MASTNTGSFLIDGTTEVVCADVRRWLHAALRSNNLRPPAPELGAHVEGCALCQGALLALIAVRVELPPAMAHTTCQQCLDDLPAYIDQELEDSVSALRSYPHVWWHLLTCQICAETYQFTRALVEAEFSGHLAPMPKPGSFNFLDVVRLSRQALARLLAPSPVFGMATRGGGKRRPIILAEEDQAEGYTLTLSAEAQVDGAWRLQIRADPPFAGQMLLTLGDLSFQSAFDPKGVATVADVPTPLLLQPDGPDLVVSLAPGEGEQ